jgi:hypothetical protein
MKKSGTQSRKTTPNIYPFDDSGAGLQDGVGRRNDKWSRRKGSGLELLRPKDHAGSNPGPARLAKTKASSQQVDPQKG